MLLVLVVPGTTVFSLCADMKRIPVVVSASTSKNDFEYVAVIHRGVCHFVRRKQIEAMGLNNQIMQWVDDWREYRITSTCLSFATAFQ